MSLSSVIIYVKALDTSSTIGAGKSGLAFGDFTAVFGVQGGVRTSLTCETITTLGTYQAPTSNAHIRIKEWSSSAPTDGIYEIHLHNDQVAVAGTKLWLYLAANGALIDPYELPLFDIHGRLPAALTGDGNIKADTLRWGGTAVASANVLIDGAITAAKFAADAITAAKIADGALTAAKFASGAFDAVWSVSTRTLTAATNLTTAIAAAVWEVATSGLTTAGTIGKLLVDNINATISSRSSHAAADVWAVGTRTLTSISGLGIALATKLTKYVQLLTRKDSAIAADNATELAEINANGGSGAGAFANTTDSEEAIRDRGDAAWVTGSGGGGLTGARTVTITVDDGTDPIVGAKVRLTDGVLGTGADTTDADGEVTFNVDDASWTVAITKPGYSFAGATLVVNGDETQSYSMTAVSITPSDPDKVTGYVTCEIEGVAAAGVVVYLEQQKPAAGSGLAYDSSRRTDTSNGLGVAQFENLQPGATFRFWRGTDAANARIVTIPAGASDPYPLDSIVGQP